MATTMISTVAVGATSPYIYLGQAKPPYTLYFIGGYTGNVVVQSSPNAFDGNVPVNPAPAGFAEFGEIIGNETAALARPNNTIATIRHPIQAIRFDGSGVTVASAIIYIVMDH